MNILIYGGKGWIGSQFCEALTLGHFKHTVSNTRINTLQDVMDDLNNNPETTHVISFIGRTHGKTNGKTYSTIDYLEQPGKIKDNVRDNLFVPLIIAEACKKYSKNNRFVHYTYFGTGCIFSYDNEHPYEKEENGFKEEDAPNFFGSSYSVVKGRTDQLMSLLYDETCLNLRIRMPITGKDNPRNFITKITTYEKICSIKNSMTVLPEFIPIIVDMMKKQITGTMNLTNPGLISHNEMLEMYKEYVDPTFTWKNFTIEEQAKILASERSNNYLDTTKLQSLYPDVKNIKDSVRCILQYYSKKKLIENK
jgi:3,5-epimerase/4-reductase